jgi:hypothetical protein
MTILQQTLFGSVILALGAVKTWLHMGSVPVLVLPMCNGATRTILLDQGGGFAAAHCWGCYALPAGALLIGLSAMRHLHKRRSVASITD